MTQEKQKPKKSHQKHKENIIFEELYEEEDTDIVNLLDSCRIRDTIKDYDTFDYINER